MDGEWIRVCAAGEIEPGDLRRFDHGGRTFVVIRAEGDAYFATDGHCTHEKVHLADGFVVGNVVECPKHNGCFDFRTGAATRRPAREPLRTWPVKVEGGQVLVQVG
jgi:3-phenylpropionate/trans-cinnamate dioxygenase ferredoxin subunit